MACPARDPSANEAVEPLVGTFTFQHLNMVLSGACMAIVWISCIGLQGLHFLHMSKPAEQIKIAKITTLFPAYSLVSFMSITFPKASVSLKPWIEVVQALALSSFFLLLCEYVSPHKTQRDLFFAALDVRSGSEDGTRENGLVWFRRRWIFIFQYPVVTIFLAIVTDITESIGRFCDTSTKPRFAYIWVTVIAVISVFMALASIIAMYENLKTHIAQHKPLEKLLVFKGIIGFTFVEKIIFLILKSTDSIKPSAKVSYDDINVGIYHLIICLALVPFSLFFHRDYSYKPYIIRPLGLVEQETGAKSEAATQRSYSSPFRAFLSFLSPKEVLQGIAFMFELLFRRDTQLGEIRQ